MANLTENGIWVNGIYQLEVTDKVNAGIGGNGISNLQALQLANRTAFLYNKIRFNQNFSSTVTVASGGSNVNFDNSSYVFAFPLGTPFYTTPNDGLTRSYIITISFFTDFTYNSSGNIIAFVYTSTAGPTLQYIVNARLKQPYQSMTYSKVITLGPGVPIKAAFGNNATGANATFQDISLSIIEL